MDRNPYNSTRPGNLFTGYEKMRRGIIQGLRNGKSYAIMGGRRCGKTSLLRQLEQDLRQQAPLLPRFLDIQGQIPHSTADFFVALSQLMVKGTAAVPWAGSQSNQPYQDFLKHLKEASEQIQNVNGSNWCVVFLIDELEIAAQHLPNDECFHNLRNFLMTSDFERHVRVVISGVSGLSHLIKSGSPLNNLEKQSLSQLSIEAAKTLIQAGFGSSLIGLTEQRLLELTGAHPWLLQGILEYLWEDRDSLDENSLRNAVRQFARTRDGVFQSWVKSFGEAGRAAYQALASSTGGGLTAKQIRAVLPSAATIDSTLEVLSFHGVIDDSDTDRVRTSASIFRDWFTQNVALLSQDKPEAGAERSAETQEPTVPSSDDRRRNVFIVYGRDRRFHSEVCLFLRALNIVPLEWNRIVEATGKGAPTIFEIIEKGFSMAGAAIVLMTPDDEARLRDHFRQEHDPSYEKQLTPQPRPNVIFEAGLAMAKFRDKTVLVRAGPIRQFSDISGMHLLDLNNDMATRDHFAKRLESCGLKIDRSDTYWHRAGDLTPTKSN